MASGTVPFLGPQSNDTDKLIVVVCAAIVLAIGVEYAPGIGVPLAVIVLLAMLAFSPLLKGTP